MSKFFRRLTYTLIDWIYYTFGIRSTCQEICKELLTVTDVLEEWELVQDIWVITGFKTKSLEEISIARLEAICVRSYEIISGRNIQIPEKCQFIFTMKGAIEDLYNDYYGFYDRGLMTKDGTVFVSIYDGSDGENNTYTSQLFLITKLITDKLKEEETRPEL